MVDQSVPVLVVVKNPTGLSRREAFEWTDRLFGFWLVVIAGRRPEGRLELRVTKDKQFTVVPVHMHAELAEMYVDIARDRYGLEAKLRIPMEEPP